MQKVAWPMVIVQSERLMPPNAKNELRAMPVMIPGRAIGRTRRNETTSRPKNRKRWTPKAAADPSTSATPVASAPAFNDSTSAARTSGSWNATENHLREKLEIGQLWMFDRL